MEMLFINILNIYKQFKWVLRFLPWSQCGGQFALAWSAKNLNWNLDWSLKFTLNIEILKSWNWGQGFFFLRNLVTWWPKKKGGGLQLVQNNFLKKIPPNSPYFKGKKKVEIAMGDFNKIPLFSMTKFDKAKFICSFIHFSVWWLLQFDTIVICVVTNSSVKAYYRMRSHILL